jgi:hypothetical protein
LLLWCEVEIVRDIFFDKLNFWVRIYMKYPEMFCVLNLHPQYLEFNRSCEFKGEKWLWTVYFSNPTVVITSNSYSIIKYSRWHSLLCLGSFVVHTLNIIIIYFFVVIMWVYFGMLLTCIIHNNWWLIFFIDVLFSYNYSLNRDNMKCLLSLAVVFYWSIWNERNKEFLGVLIWEQLSYFTSFCVHFNFAHV